MVKQVEEHNICILARYWNVIYPNRGGPKKDPPRQIAEPDDDMVMKDYLFTLRSFR